MKKVFYHYKKWEDHQHGMFRSTCENEEQIVKKCMLLLSDTAALEVAMRLVLNWRHSAEINLSNRSRNRQAWLGQAACCNYCGAPEYITKQAWNLLTDGQREKANSVADRIISEWESSYTPQS